MRLPLFRGLLAVMFTLVAGCARKTPLTTPVATVPAVKWPVKSPDFIDLLPEWRVREVTPIFASGGYVAKGNAKQEGTTITLSNTDFEGYETALYALKPRPGAGVEAMLASVESTKGDQKTTELKPRVALFQFPRRVRYIRLVYLVRVSNADHNMAILGSDDVDRLSALTKQVQDDPEAGCRNARRAYCTWVPQGVAVNPEVPREVNGETRWAPAR